MEAEGCKEYEVHMTRQCQRDYGKLSKKMDRRLHEHVEPELDALRCDPHRGSRLGQNLKGMRSIHIDKFSYRIVYEADR